MKAAHAVGKYITKDTAMDGMSIPMNKGQKASLSPDFQNEGDMIKGETAFRKARFCLLKEMTLMKKAVTALGIACLAVFLYILHLPFIFGQTATGFIFIQRAYAQMRSR